MPFTPTAGQYAVCKITPSGGSAVTVPGQNWKLSDDGKPKDVSNFRDGRARVGTLADSTLSCTLVWDSAANPTLNANGGISRGNSIVAQLYTDPATTKPITFNGIIATLEPSNEGVEGTVMLSFTALQSGAACTYPGT